MKRKSKLFWLFANIFVTLFVTLFITMFHLGDLEEKTNSKTQNNDVNYVAKINVQREKVKLDGEQAQATKLPNPELKQESHRDMRHDKTKLDKGQEQIMPETPRQPNPEPKEESHRGGFGKCSNNASNTVNVISSLMPEDNSTCMFLEWLTPSLHICIHDPKIDHLISGSISQRKFWEPNTVKIFERILLANPYMGVIDIGSNIGQYTLLGAYRKRKVLSVEARLLHIHMLYRSLQLNNFLDRVTLVHNAISDSYATVTLGIDDVTNQGGASIKTVATKVSQRTKTVASNWTATTITMGDLVEYADFTQAVLKIDIEGFELEAFTCADPLFDKLDIPYILMEWSLAKRPEELVKRLLSWFNDRDYEAFRITELLVLDFNDYKEWPWDIVLKHKSRTFEDLLLY